jgi:hypothetical protein
MCDTVRNRTNHLQCGNKISLIWEKEPIIADMATKEVDSIEVLILVGKL